MRRQTSIIIGFLNQILRARPLIVEPHQQIGGLLHVGDEYTIAVLGRIEQLVLLRFAGWLPRGLLPVPHGDEAICFSPSLRLISKLALIIGIGARRSLPVGRFQLIHQPRRFACRDDELYALALVSLDRLPAIET